MKMQDRIFFKQVLKPVIVHLTSIAEEPFVKEITNAPRKIFSAVDMWNIQRRRRSVMVR